VERLLPPKRFRHSEAAYGAIATSGMPALSKIGILIPVRTAENQSMPERISETSGENEARRNECFRQSCCGLHPLARRSGINASEAL
jgi:hypothetical protein